LVQWMLELFLSIDCQMGRQGTGFGTTI